MNVVAIVIASIAISILLFACFIIYFSVGYTGKKGKMYRFAWKIIDKYLGN